MHSTSDRASWALTLLAATLLLGSTASRTGASGSVPGAVAWSKTPAGACRQMVADLLPYRMLGDQQTAVRVNPESGRIEFNRTSRARDGLAQELRFDYTCSFAPQGESPVLIDIAIHYL